MATHPLIWSRVKEMRTRRRDAYTGKGSLQEKKCTYTEERYAHGEGNLAGVKMYVHGEGKLAGEKMYVHGGEKFAWNCHVYTVEKCVREKVRTRMRSLHGKDIRT